MTEAAMAYREDVAERSDVKKSAQCRKNGSRTMKLGNRRMTYKEIIEKHGEVKMYSMDKFMTYSEFRELPNDLKVEYINKLCDKYDISIKHVSRYLFHQGDIELQKYLRINGILKFCNPDKKRSKTGLLQFQNDILDSTRKPSVSDTKEETKVDTIETKQSFISHDAFKKLSLDQQVGYINSLIIDYKVGLGAISGELFNKSESNLDAYFRSKKVKDKIVKSTSVASFHELSKNRGLFRNEILKWKETLKDNKEEVIVKEIKNPNTATDEPPVRLDQEEPKTLTPAAVETKEPGEIMDYRDSSYASSYIRVGLDEDELNGLQVLFRDKRVKVDIRITMI